MGGCQWRCALPWCSSACTMGILGVSSAPLEFESGWVVSGSTLSPVVCSASTCAACWLSSRAAAASRKPSLLGLGCVHCPASPLDWAAKEAMVPR